MKKLKKVVIFSLLIVMNITILLNLNINKAQAADNLNYEYVVVGDAVTITKYLGNEQEVVVPTEINGKIVNSIGEYAFSQCSFIKRIKLPDTIISIGNEAFKDCYRLENLNIPNGIKIISNGVFYNCIKLKNIQLPNGLEKINSKAFVNCKSLLDINIPNTVVFIGDNAFNMCKKITEVNIPNRITKIEDSVFYGCEYLSEVNIPEGVTSIGNSAFSLCKNLEYINIPNSVELIGSSAFSYCTKLKSVVIPNKIKNILSFTFRKCTNLSDIVFNANIPNINENAFEGCDNLNINLVIPKEVLEVDEDKILSYDNLSIYGYENTYAKEFASKNQLDFNNISEITIDEFKSDITSPQLIKEKFNFECLSNGGVGKKRYKYIIKKNSDIVLETCYLVENNIEWYPKEEGIYQVYVKVLDGIGNIKEECNEYTIYNKLQLLNTSINKTSPQLVGSEMEILAETKGGLGDIKYSFIISKDSKPCIREFDSDINKIKWVPTEVGVYHIEYSVKDESGVVIKKIENFEVKEKLIITECITNLEDQKCVGENVKLQVNATGGIGNKEYRFVVNKLEESGKEINVYSKKYSTINNSIWIPKEAGQYKIYFKVKDNLGNEVSEVINCVIVNKGEILVVSNYSNVEGPQKVGTSITFSTEAYSDEVLKYRFAVLKDGVAYYVRGYNSLNSTSWVPTEEGIYTVYYKVKNTSGVEVTKTSNLIITGEEGILVDDYGVDLVSPQKKGTIINLYMTAYSKEDLEYRFVVLKDGQAVYVRGYKSTSKTECELTEVGIYNIYFIVKTESGTKITKTIDYEITE